MKEKTTEKGRAWLKREMRPYRPFVLFMAFLTVAGTLLSLAFAYLTRYIVNNAVEGNARLLLVFSAVLLAVLLARIAVQTSVKYFLERARAKINAGLRGKLFARILRSDYAGLEKYHSGDLLNRLTTDVSAVASGTVSMLPALAGMAVQCVGAIAALLTLDALFTGIFVAGGLSVCALTVLVRRKMKKYHKELVEADGKSRSFIQESLSSALTVKAYGAEDKATEKSDALLDSYFGKRMKKNRLDSCMNGLFSLFSNAGVIFALVWCGISILRGNMDYGSVLSIILLLGQLEYPFAMFSSILPVYYARAASAERLSELDDIPSEKMLPASSAPLSSSESFSPSAPSSSSAPLSSSESFSPSVPSLSPTPTLSSSPSAHRYNFFPVPTSVLPFTENSLTSGLYEQTKGFRIKKLTFDYGRERLFSEADAEFAKGGVICITGESGSGKSTLFKLLMHIYAPLSGGIYAIAGDGEHLLTERERGLFAYVPQGNFLFSGTIRENLAFFSEEESEATLEERERRAVKAACAEFVFGLPEGLDTPLRERGGGLSEGQLQRLAVARALLSERPILLLDEATSALDGETEKRLLENIRKEKNKTCLIVTHRPAALEIADVVLRVQGGKIERI